MCQPIGKCYVDDPFAREKTALREIQRFLAKNPSANGEAVEKHLIAEHKYVDLGQLRPMVEAILHAREESGLSEQAEEFRRILALLP